MTDSQRLRPVPDPGTATFPVTAGALMRRHVRAQLDLLGLTYREHKGWLDSTFIVSGPLPAARRFSAWIEALGGES